MPEEIVRVNEANQKSDRLEKQVATPADFTSPEVLYEDLIQEIRKYHPSSDLSDIERAYKIARDAHEGQKRKSGEPYIIHPLCVAIILAELELDKETIIAGLLHDVVEDTVMTSEDVTREFGAEVALLVDGVTKLTQLNYQHDKIEVQAENLRKMFLAMAKDIRVILIKLADRLHNMRTMQYQTPAKQIEKSRETMEIYAPIAHRLGISKIKVELDDLALRYLKPDVYEDLELNEQHFQQIKDIEHELEMAKELKDLDYQDECRSLCRYCLDFFESLGLDSDEIDALNEAQSFFDQQDSQENQQLEGAKRWVDEMMSNYQNGDTGMYDQMKSTMESLGIDEERLKNMSNEEVDQYVQDMCKKFGISQSLFDKLKDKFGR